MKGRKATPTVLKLLRGNPGKRELNGEEPRPVAAVPDCPAHLNDVAREEWSRLTRELSAVNLLTNLDRGSLAAYCVAWSRWCEAEQRVREMGAVVKSPTGFPIQNPYLAIANKAMEQMHKLAAEFGLTPSSRTRIKAPPTKQRDEFAEFLRSA